MTIRNHELDNGEDNRSSLWKDNELDLLSNSLSSQWEDLLSSHREDNPLPLFNEYYLLSDNGEDNSKGSDSCIRVSWVGHIVLPVVQLIVQLIVQPMTSRVGQ